MKIDWNITQIWNDSLLDFGERPQTPRDYIYASELGGSMVDRYLKMIAVKASNPPNTRSRRKFQAGNIWESIINFVLLRAGILKKKQIRSEVTLPGLLRVSGRMDFLAGGYNDWDKAERELDDLDFFPEFVKWTTRQIIAKLKEEYSDMEFVEKILEAKSVSAFVMELQQRAGTPQKSHKLQNFHYLIGTGIEHGLVMYISREDCQLLDFPIFNSDVITMQDYRTDIETITGYYMNREMPPKNPEFIFDERSCRFNKNFQVEYSYYLTKLYKYKTPEEYREKFAPLAAGANRVVKRILNGDKLTDANKIIIRDTKKYFPNFDDLVELARVKGVADINEEEA